MDDECLDCRYNPVCIRGELDLERKCPKVRREEAQERLRLQLEKGNQRIDKLYNTDSNDELEFEVRLSEEQKVKEE
jgi:hypothetical protein